MSVSVLPQYFSSSCFIWAATVGLLGYTCVFAKCSKSNYSSLQHFTASSSLRISAVSDQQLDYLSHQQYHNCVREWRIGITSVLREVQDCLKLFSFWFSEGVLTASTFKYQTLIPTLIKKPQFFSQPCYIWAYYDYQNKLKPLLLKYKSTMKNSGSDRIENSVTLV